MRSFSRKTPRIQDCSSSGERLGTTVQPALKVSSITSPGYEVADGEGGAIPHHSERRIRRLGRETRLGKRDGCRGEIDDPSAIFVQLGCILSRHPSLGKVSAWVRDDCLSEEVHHEDVATNLAKPPHCRQKQIILVIAIENRGVPLLERVGVILSRIVQGICFKRSASSGTNVCQPAKVRRGDVEQSLAKALHQAHVCGG